MKERDVLLAGEGGSQAEINQMIKMGEMANLISPREAVVAIRGENAHFPIKTRMRVRAGTKKQMGSWTPPEDVIKKRRARNKAAKKSRRKNR